MDRKQVRLALLKITTCVLLATTWVFWSFVFATRPEKSDAPADTLTNLVRLPASLPSALAEPLVPVFGAGPRATPVIEMGVVALPCWDRKDAMVKDTSARWIRLTGRACEKASGRSAVSVRNLSNGYTATVFDARAGDLTTDFIPLQTGKNDILVRFEAEPGVHLESQFTFLRE